MRVYDVIHKKRRGQALTKDEIRDVIDGYVKGEIPDYQMSAFAMAVCFQGMTDDETTNLTLAMAHSGHVLNLENIPGIKVDKHSTGGVGDTTTLVLAPLVASVGVPIAKMSGRGLGHTGGTIDKLESISGFSAQMSLASFCEQVRRVGVAVAGQTAELAPADKKLYALRDVTDTVESIPLIASSIMSKKIASGANAIVLDVKVGQGAFMKDIEHAEKLARAMVSIGTLAGRNTVAVLTQMDEPLGHAVGNALEVREAILTLRGRGPEDLTELCLVLGAEMVVLAGHAKNADEARRMLQNAIEDGRALAKFKAFVEAQGGDARVADDLSLLPKACVVKSFLSPRDGVIQSIKAEAVGLIAMKLGAGRAKHDDVIDPSVGLILQRKVGQTIQKGETLVEVHAASEAAVEEAIQALAACIEISPGSAFESPLVLGVIRDEGASVGVNPLVEQARFALAGAYVPYSKFAVGAALRLSNGAVVTGANVENASYGLTNCAERTALFQFVNSPAFRAGVKVEEIAVIADSDGPVAPCGACRQVMAEFCPPNTPVVLSDLKGQTKQTSLSELLPYAFGAAQME